ncbi:MAG: hypothetical protein JWM89_2355 [Acidimicrobiales bacterium]|nr:hypothetical protein [Acidimicrobiales bacterium]
MKILLYLLVPVLVVAAFATVSWVRNRQPTSLESGVDAFKREMSALSPEAAPAPRRRPEGGSDSRPGPAQRQPPRRPPNAERSD